MIDAQFMNAISPLFDLPYSHQKPNICGVLRQRPEFFQVEELLGFEPEGEGEHVFVWLEKRLLNTQYVAEQLAKVAKVAIRHVSYSGMKDRNAVTRQWFSVHLPGNAEIDFSVLNNDQLTVLKQCRHRKKLRRGIHHGNQFIITLCDVVGDQQSLDAAVKKIQTDGFPNYFGEQRFGRDGANVQRAIDWFNGEIKPKKHLRGIYLSSARSFLFNHVLAKRVAEKNWDKLSSGELVMLNASHSVFLQKEDEDLSARLAEGDLHLTGPMYGASGSLMPEQDAADLESQVIDAYPLISEGLIKHGLKAERRALRVIPTDLQIKKEAEQVQFKFSLPRGCFATALMRELIDYRLES
jgi:tRNA pseudouridine13 synthase